ncbi:hypothetical protein PLCT2_01738 [Planctomycetaceae bacterium]|nr:hypothetical protein PLCT2_01738 [Planctomycetaceae bacterium]
MIRLALLAVLCACSLSAATITVTTNSMTIDVPGAAFIAEDPNGRTGLYDPVTLEISDLPGTDGFVSLPEAIIAANNTAGADTIVVGAATYTISAPNNWWYGPTGLPPITSEITIEGNGAIIERSSAGGTPNFRLFFVMGPFHTGGAGKVAVSPGNLTLRNLTLRNGLARGGDGGRGAISASGDNRGGSGGGGLGAGGAVFNQGQLRLDSCLVSGNSAIGGSGGERFTPTTASAWGGGGGGIGGSGADGGASGISGGGFYPARYATFTSSTIDAQSSPFGGDSWYGASDAWGGGGFRPGDNGISGSGVNGGGYPGSPNNLQGMGGGFGNGARGQASGGGIGGGGGSGASTQTSGSGGFGGGGGGQVGSGVTAGVSGGGGNGGFGGGGGAGHHNTFGPGTGDIGFRGFGGGDGTSGGPAFGWGGGGAGMGGALFNHTGTLTIINCTFTQNSATGGSSPDISTNGQGMGGALFNLNGGVLMVSSTLAGNSASGGNLNYGGNVYSLALHGKGVQDAPGTSILTIENSIIADATGDSNVTVAQGGHPFDNPTGTSVSSLTTDSVSIIEGGINNSGATVTGTPFTVDPMLAALANNGGPTQSMAPNTGSPAINGGNNAAANIPARDQRGVSRIKGGTVDVGSVETGANVAPVITAPASLIIAQNTAHTFAATLSIADDAAWGTTLQLTLTATQGTVTLATIAGLAFTTGDGTADAAITCTGTLDAINAALNGATFTPTTSYLGAASLQIGVDDQGNTGGGALTDSETVILDVQAANQAPVITAPATTGTQPDTVLVFTTLSIADADAGTASLEVTLTATNGTLTLAALAGLTFNAGDGTADAAMTFTGNLTDINAALNGASFTPALAFTGAATLQIDVDDQGNTGPGGALTDTHIITVNVTVPSSDNGDDDESCTTGEGAGFAGLLLVAIALVAARRGRRLRA